VADGWLPFAGLVEWSESMPRLLPFILIDPFRKIVGSPRFRNESQLRPKCCFASVARQRVRARDMGEDANRELLRYFAGRRIRLLMVDDGAFSPALRAYAA
jgi:hypothetical protein